MNVGGSPIYERLPRATNLFPVKSKPMPLHQEFPASGVLARNLNVQLPGFETGRPVMPEIQRSEFPRLTSDLENDEDKEDESSAASTSRGQNEPVFAYVLTSLQVIGDQILQTGCGPQYIRRLHNALHLYAQTQNLAKYVEGGLGCWLYDDQVR
jgi:hypothetical protein